MKFIYRLTSTEIFFQYEACLFDLFIFLELLLLFQVDRDTHEIFAALRVACFKPITWYIKMHHVRTFFLCGVMIFSYYVMFIHNTNVCDSFIVSALCSRGRRIFRNAVVIHVLYLQEKGLPCFLSAIELLVWPHLSAEYKIWSRLIRSGSFRRIRYVLDKDAVSFRLEDKHVVNEHHVIRSRHDARHKISPHHFNVPRDWLETNSRHQSGLWENEAEFCITT